MKTGTKFIMVLIGFMAFAMLLLAISMKIHYEQEPIDLAKMARTQAAFNERVAEALVILAATDKHAVDQARDLAEAEQEKEAEEACFERLGEHYHSGCLSDSYELLHPTDPVVFWAEFEDGIADLHKGIQVERWCPPAAVMAKLACRNCQKRVDKKAAPQTASESIDQSRWKSIGAMGRVEKVIEGADMALHNAKK